MRAARDARCGSFPGYPRGERTGLRLMRVGACIIRLCVCVFFRWEREVSCFDDYQATVYL